METLVTTSAAEAAAIIIRGGLVAFPTETVYGLGADVFNSAAVQRIFAAKERPADNPLIAHVSSAEQIESLSNEITDAARTLIERFFPGPLTVVVKKAVNVPLAATAGLASIAIRMPRLPLANEFLIQCKNPVVAPSANLSGRPSPTSWQAVSDDLDGRIDCILKGPDTEIGLESTVVDCTGKSPMILRTGAVSLEALRELFPDISVVRSVANNAVKSPGLRHKHYSPKATVTLVVDGQEINASKRASFIGMRTPAGKFELIKICSSVEDYAHSLFTFFRESDRRGIPEIYCETVSETGIGMALMDRLRRAAAD